MSTNAAFEPFEYIDGDDSGWYGHRSCRKSRKSWVWNWLSTVEFKALVTELQTGKCDFVAAGMLMRTRLKTSISVTVTNASQSIIVPIDSDIQGAEDLDGKKIGVQLGTTGATY